MNYHQRVQNRIKMWRIFILETIDNNGPITRSELCKHTNLPRTTIYDQLKRMLDDGTLTTFTRKTKERGRPSVYYTTKRKK